MKTGTLNLKTILSKLTYQLQPLVPYIVFSIILHVILLWIVKFSPNVLVKPPVAFDVRLTTTQSTATKPSATLPVQTRQKIQISPRPAAKKDLNKPLNSLVSNSTSKTIDVQSNTKQPVATINMTPQVDTSKSKTSTENLLESAHRIAIEDALAMPKEKDDGIALADRPVSLEIAKAIGKKKRHKAEAGTYTANGVVIQVAPDGSSTCFLPPAQSSMPFGAFQQAPSMQTACPEE